MLTILSHLVYNILCWYLRLFKDVLSLVLWCFMYLLVLRLSWHLFMYVHWYIRFSMILYVLGMFRIVVLLCIYTSIQSYSHEWSFLYYASICFCCSIHIFAAHINSYPNFCCLNSHVLLHKQRSVCQPMASYRSGGIWPFSESRLEFVWGPRFLDRPRQTVMC